MSRPPSKLLITKRRKIVTFLVHVRTDKEIAKEMRIETRTVYRLIATLTKRGVIIKSRKNRGAPGRHYWLDMSEETALRLVSPKDKRTGRRIRERSSRPWYVLTNNTGYGEDELA